MYRILYYLIQESIPFPIPFKQYSSPSDYCRGQGPVNLKWWWGTSDWKFQETVPKWQFYSSAVFIFRVFRFLCLPVLLYIFRLIQSVAVGLWTYWILILSIQLSINTNVLYPSEIWGWNVSKEAYTSSNGELTRLLQKLLFLMKTVNVVGAYLPNIVFQLYMN